MCPQLSKDLRGGAGPGGARAALPPGGWVQPTSQCRPKPPLPPCLGLVLHTPSEAPVSYLRLVLHSPSAAFVSYLDAATQTRDGKTSPKLGRVSDGHSNEANPSCANFTAIRLPKLDRVSPGTEERGKTRKHNAIQIKPCAAAQRHRLRVQGLPCRRFTARPARLACPLCTRRSLTTHRAAPRMAPPLRCPGSVGRVTRDEESRWPW